MATNPGSSRQAVEKAVKGVSNQKIRDAINELLEVGRLVFPPNGRTKGLFVSENSLLY